MRRVFYMIQKEFRQIRRTRAYLAIIFVAPFVMLLVIGSALTTEVKHVRIAILDQDRTPLSREILDSFSSTSSFTYVGEVASQEAAVKLLDDGRAKMVAVIPPDFEREVMTGQTPKVQLLIDGVDGNSAGVALGYAQGVLAPIQSEWAQRLASMPLTFSLSPTPGKRVTTVPRMWYNANLDSKLNFVPALVGMLLVMITMLVMAMNIVREKEIGTLEQLMVTPLRGIQIIVGKLVPFLILGLAQLTVGVIAAGLVFGIWMKGSLLVLYAMATIFCLSTLGLGLLVSTVAKTQQQAMFVAWFLMIFAILLSGILVPIENMPPLIQDITYINPLRYFMVVLREIYLKGTGIRYLWHEAAALGAIGIAALFFASIRFQKRLS